MSSTLRAIFRVRIQAGRLDEFREHARGLLAMVEANCPGTIEYEWFLDAANSQCVVLETFSDSRAFLAHVDVVGERAARMFALCDIENIWLCGDPSAAVVQRSAAFAPGMYACWLGKGR